LEILIQWLKDHLRVTKGKLAEEVRDCRAVVNPEERVLMLLHALVLDLEHLEIFDTKLSCDESIGDDCIQWYNDFLGNK